MRLRDRLRTPLVGAVAAGAGVAVSLGLDGPAAAVVTGVIAGLSVIGGAISRGRDTDGDGVPDWLERETPAFRGVIRRALVEADADTLAVVRRELHVAATRCTECGAPVSRGRECILDPSEIDAGEVIEAWEHYVLDDPTDRETDYIVRRTEMIAAVRAVLAARSFKGSAP